jgi:solute:Na+ symporter, SSS family
VNLHLLLLCGYSAALVALGLAVSRRVTSSSGFFVANRRLPAALLFSTLLAANIGAGSTVGATGLAYRDGLSAWWWNGSAGIGSLLLAFWIAPRAWRLASEHGFLTTGDLLEFRFGSAIRGAISLMLWLATLSILAGQLIGIAWILYVVAGVPKWAGCMVGGVLVTTYFAAGGLLGSAWVNVVQLGVKLVGFAIALPVVVAHVGGTAHLLQARPEPGFTDFWRGASSLGLVALLVPAFMSSPGLVQKIFGAESARAVKFGAGGNAVMLLVFGVVPALLGMSARLLHPGLAQELALPTLLKLDLPAGIGSLLLAAIFSAEVSAADAVLFMLSTSLSQDLYRRFLNRQATDTQVLRVARLAAVAGGVCGMAIALVTPTIVGALGIFYSMLGATMLVPLLVALHARADRRREVGWSIAGGVAGVVAAQMQAPMLAGTIWTPAVLGLGSASATFAAAFLFRRVLTRHA